MMILTKFWRNDRCHYGGVRPVPEKKGREKSFEHKMAGQKQTKEAFDGENLKNFTQQTVPCVLKCGKYKCKKKP